MLRKIKMCKFHFLNGDLKIFTSNYFTVKKVFPSGYGLNKIYNYKPIYSLVPITKAYPITLNYISKFSQRELLNFVSIIMFINV